MKPPCQPNTVALRSGLRSELPRLSMPCQPWHNETDQRMMAPTHRPHPHETQGVLLLRHVALAGHRALGRAHLRPSHVGRPQGQRHGARHGAPRARTDKPRRPRSAARCLCGAENRCCGGGTGFGRQGGGARRAIEEDEAPSETDCPSVAQGVSYEPRHRLSISISASEEEYGP